MNKLRTLGRIALSVVAGAALTACLGTTAVTADDEPVNTHESPVEVSTLTCGVWIGATEADATASFNGGDFPFMQAQLDANGGCTLGEQLKALVPKLAPGNVGVVGLWDPLSQSGIGTSPSGPRDDSF
jgi:hypothetical protein